MNASVRQRDEIVAQTDFALNPALDADALARSFAASGRLHVPDLLAGDAAAQLLAHLKQRQHWKLVINQGEKLFELDRAAQAELTAEKRAQLDLAVHQGARHGFQFRYETIRIPDDPEQRRMGDDVLGRLATFLSSDPMLSFLRHVTADPTIDFADAQATAYGPGDFLTEHDDDVAGKSRRAAYVLGLTPDWRIDWGGLLQFRDADGHVGQAYVPRFNSLNLFAVPAVHSVSMVAPFVPYRRYSVTGWLRATGLHRDGSRA